MTLAVPPRDGRRYDLVALGEVMLRLDPGDVRIRTARSFRCWEGGGEYNVARGLRRCFGLRTGIVTALADNEVGRLIEDLVLQGGVEHAHLGWLPYDGIGATIRNGLNFTERGFGVRAPLGVSDRARSAASQLAPGDVDWERIFAREGCRWLHTGGIFCALSETTSALAEEAMLAARAHGAVVSYDLNFRPSLWQERGGPARAAEVNRALVRHVDVLLGNEEDFAAALGFEVEGADEHLLALDPERYGAMLRRVADAYPGLGLVATTLRTARTATRNDWSAACLHDGVLHASRSYDDLEVYDRVGGGDSFVSGLVFGLLDGRGVADALELGAAHGALAMTTPGDTSMAMLAEVERVARGGSARVSR